MSEERGRQRTIGSSDVPAILGMGLGNDSTPYAVWARLVGLLPPFEGNEFTYWGNALEPVIAERAMQDLGVPYTKNNESYRNPKLPEYISATPDYLSYKPSILECKNTSWFKKKEWEDGAIPDYAHIQTTHQMNVTGIHSAHVAGLIGGNSFVLREVEFSELLADGITEQLKDFWKLVETNTPPDISANDVNVIKRIYPAHQDGWEVVTSDPEILQLFEILEESKNAIDNWSKKQAKARAELQAIMKDAEHLVCNDYRASWKAYNRTSVDAKQLKEELPEIYETVKKTTLTRPFRVTFPKGEE